MGCIYSNFEGKCSLYEEDAVNNPRGCTDLTDEDSQGTCVVEEDPIPIDSCEDFESDGNDEELEDED